MSVSKVLLVDDDPNIRTSFARVLRSAGFDVRAVESAEMALAALREPEGADVIVTDLVMPGMDGLEFMHSVRLLDLDVPVIVLTAHPSLETAMSTVEYGVHRYLKKPIDPNVLAETVSSAAAMHRLAILKRRALEVCDTIGWRLGDKANLEEHFEAAMRRLWVAYQPIVLWPSGTIYGYEALMRSHEPALERPGPIFDAAERLGRVHELGRRMRKLLASEIHRAPPECLIFANLHSADLTDEDLYAPNAPLSTHAERIVLEITERASLDRVGDVRGRMASLRRLGFQIAVDDLGAGYAGLASFGQLEPQIVKLDMSLIRGVDADPRKSSIVRSMIAVCVNDLGTRVVCEGVETVEERDTLHRLGADLLQGYLFGRPEPHFLVS